MKKRIIRNKSHIKRPGVIDLDSPTSFVKRSGRYIESELGIGYLSMVLIEIKWLLRWLRVYYIFRTGSRESIDHWLHQPCIIYLLLTVQVSSIYSKKTHKTLLKLLFRYRGKKFINKLTVMNNGCVLTCAVTGLRIESKVEYESVWTNLPKGFNDNIGMFLFLLENSLVFSVSFVLSWSFSWSLTTFCR